MYLHAYQSLIWNKVVSRRVKEFGLKVLPGDLVEVEAGTEEEKLLENNEESEDDEMGPEEGKLTSRSFKAVASCVYLVA